MLSRPARLRACRTAAEVARLVGRTRGKRCPVERWLMRGGGYERVRVDPGGTLTAWTTGGAWVREDVGAAVARFVRFWDERRERRER